MSAQNTESSHAKLLGELGSIGLAEIFETLGTKNRYGWLTLKNKEKEVVLYFQGDLVGLSTLPEDKLSYIPEKLYYSGKINENQYQLIIESEEPLATLEEVVDSDDILSLLNTIYYDEICYLFSWKDGYFEFVDQKSGDEAGEIGKFFEAETVLLDATRRLDENKEVLKVFVNQHEIFIHNIDVSGNEQLSPDDPFGNVWNLANHKSFQEVIYFSYLSEFDSAKILATLYEDEQIRLLTDEELQSYAQDLDQEQNIANAEKCYRLLIQRDPYNIEACEALISYNENSGNKDVLEELYEQIAGNLISSENMEYRTQGAYYLKKYCDLKQDISECLDPSLHLLDMVINQGVSSSVIEYDPLKDGKALFQVFRRQKQDQKAKFVLENLVKLCPDDISFQSELVNILLDLGEKEKAIEHYDILAELYESKNNTTELIGIYQKILRLTPRKDIQQKLDRLTSRKKNRSGIFIKFIILLLVGAGIVVGVDYAKDFMEKQKNQKQQLQSDIKNLIEENLLLQAKNKTISSNLLNEIEKNAFIREIQTKEELFSKKIDKEYENAILTQQKGDLVKAKEIIDEIKSFDVQIKEDLAKEIDIMYKDISEKLLYFSVNFAKAQELEKQNNFNEAIAIYKKLWDTADYKQHFNRHLIKYPIKLNIDNSNKATILVDSELIGIDKENVIRVSPGFFEIEVNIPGYARYILYNAFHTWDNQTKETEKGTLYPLKQAEISVKLKKQSLWSYKLGGIVEAKPCYAEGKLYIAARDDHIYTLENLQTTPFESWLSYKPNSLASFTSSPMLHGETLYIAGNNYTLYAVKKNIVIAKYSLPQPSLISAPVVISTNYNLVYFSTENGWIYAMPLVTENVNNWQPKWRRTISDKKKILSSLHENHLFINSRNGYIYCLEAQGKPKWRIRIPKPSDTLPVIYNNIIYVGGNGALYACDIQSGKILWESLVKGRISDQPAVNEHGIFFGTSSFVVYNIGHDGKKIWEAKKDDDFSYGPVINSKDKMYIASRNGIVYSMNQKNGETIWEYKIQENLPEEEKITSPLLLVENILFVGAHKTVYAFTDN